MRVAMRMHFLCRITQKMNCVDQAAPQQPALSPVEISTRHGRGGFNPYVNNGG